MWPPCRRSLMGMPSHGYVCTIERVCLQDFFLNILSLVWKHSGTADNALGAIREMLDVLIKWVPQEQFVPGISKARRAHFLSPRSHDLVLASRLPSANPS